MAVGLLSFMHNVSKHLTRQLLFCLLLCPLSALAETVPVLTLSPTQTSDGKATISWPMPEGVKIGIESSRDMLFTNPVNLYQGSDEATVLTGLSDGAYYFRGRYLYQNGAFSPWSEPVGLSVEHHSLAKALAFFSIGAVVFVATLLLIILGAKRQD
jgi:hypothetical protein